MRVFHIAMLIRTVPSIARLITSVIRRIVLIKDVFGIFKAYTTRVGSGPLPTELFDEIGGKIAKTGNEFGATTGRPRRCGWLDLVALKYACRINGVTKLMMMKTDVLSGFDKILVCTKYRYRGEITENLPYNLSEEHNYREGN